MSNPNDLVIIDPDDVEMRDDSDICPKGNKICHCKEIKCRSFIEDLKNNNIRIKDINFNDDLTLDDLKKMKKFDGSKASGDYLEALTTKNFFGISYKDWESIGGTAVMDLPSRATQLETDKIVKDKNNRYNGIYNWNYPASNISLKSSKYDGKKVDFRNISKLSSGNTIEGGKIDRYLQGGRDEEFIGFHYIWTANVINGKLISIPQQLVISDIKPLKEAVKNMFKNINIVELNKRLGLDGKDDLNIFEISKPIIKYLNDNRKKIPLPENYNENLIRLKEINKTINRNLLYEDENGKKSRIGKVNFRPSQPRMNIVYNLKNLNKIGKEILRVNLNKNANMIDKATTIEEINNLLEDNVNIGGKELKLKDNNFIFEFTEGRSVKTLVNEMKKRGLKKDEIEDLIFDIIHIEGFVNDGDLNGLDDFLFNLKLNVKNSIRSFFNADPVNKDDGDDDILNFFLGEEFEAREIEETKEDIEDLTKEIEEKIDDELEEEFEKIREIKEERRDEDQRINNLAQELKEILTTGDDEDLEEFILFNSDTILGVADILDEDYNLELSPIPIENIKNMKDEVITRLYLDFQALGEIIRNFDQNEGNDDQEEGDGEFNTEFENLLNENSDEEFIESIINKIDEDPKEGGK